MYIRRLLWRLFVASFLFSAFPQGVVTASLQESRDPLPKNAWDIAVIDKVLATVKPGQKMVPFGDVGIKPDDLKMFRQRLVEEQARSARVLHPPRTRHRVRHSNGPAALSLTGLTRRRFRTAR